MPWAPGGFLGVDVFFVLSGFLITGILLREELTRTVDLGRFWARRARRLLPGLAAVLVFVALFARVVASPSDRSSIRADAFATILYSANWRFVLAHHSYFDQFSAPSPLRHAWSLAIEEQFYVVWPPVLLLMVRRLDRRRALALTLLAVAASAGLMAWTARASVSRAYYGTDTRVQALLVGAALAMLMTNRVSDGRGLDPRWSAAVGMAGAFTLLLTLAFVHDTARWMYTGGFTLVALAAAGVVTAATSARPNAVTRSLGWRPLRALGRISYGVYLWHWPLFLWLAPPRVNLAGTPLFLVRTVVTLVVASLSWVCIESPVLRGRIRLPSSRRAVVFAPAIVVTLVIVVVAAFPRNEHTASAAEALRVASRLPLTTPTTPTTARAKTPSSTTAVPTQRPHRVLVVGDSVAKMIGLGFAGAAPHFEMSVDNEGKLGCGLLPTGRLKRGGVWADIAPECANYLADWQQSVATFDPDVCLVLFDVWTVLDAEVNGTIVPFGSSQSDRMLLQRLADGVHALEARDARVVLLTAPYNGRGAATNTTNVAWDEDVPTKINHFNDLLRTYARRHPSVSVIDLNAFTAPSGTYTNVLDGIRLRYDGVHFTPGGGALAFAWLAPQLPSVPVKRP